MNTVTQQFALINEQSSAKYVQRIIKALENKALKAEAAFEFDKSVKVHFHCIDYATDFIADTTMCKFLHAAKVDSNVAEFIENMSNIKAINYLIRYAKALSHSDCNQLNNYMSSTVRALTDCDDSVSYNDVRAALSVSLTKSDSRIKQMHYSSSTASAQSSMTINALEALSIIERKSKRSKDAQITVIDDEQSQTLYEALQALVSSFAFTR